MTFDTLEHRCDLVVLQAAEEAQLHDLRQLRIDLMELDERFVHRDDLRVTVSGDVRHFVEHHEAHAAAVLAVGAPARVVGQDAPHHPGSDAEEVCAILPVDVALADQAQERFVDEIVCLERLTGALVAEIPSGQATQLVVDQGHELVEGLVVAAAPLREEQRHVVPRLIHPGVVVLGFVAHQTLPEGRSARTPF